MYGLINNNINWIESSTIQQQEHGFEYVSKYLEKIRQKNCESSTIFLFEEIRSSRGVLTEIRKTARVVQCFYLKK